MSVARAAARGAAWSAGGTWVQLVTALVTLGLVARILGPEPFGLTALAWIVVGLGEVLLVGALTESLIQRDRIEAGHKDAIFWLLQAIAFGFAGLTIAGSGLFAAAVGAPAVGPVLAASACVLPIAAAYAVPEAILMREMRVRAVVLAGNAGGILGSLAAIALAVAGAGVWSLVAMQIVAQAVRTIGVMAAARWRPGFAGRRRHLRDLFAFNIRVAAAQVAGYAERAAPRAVIGVMLGTEALGLFSLALRLQDYLHTAVVQPMARIAMPAVSRARGDAAGLRRLMAGAIGLCGAVSFPVFLGFAAVAPVAIPLVFGPQWTAAVVPAQLLAIVGLRRGMTAFNGAILRGTGYPGRQLVLTATSLALTLALTPPAALIGVNAVVAAIVLRAFLTLPMSNWFVARTTGFGLRDQLAVNAPPMVAALVMAALVSAGIAAGRGVLAEPVLLALAVAGGAALYAGLLPALSPDLRRLIGRARAAGALARPRAWPGLLGGGEPAGAAGR